MHVTTVVKPLLSLIGIIGGCCAIAIPITISYQKISENDHDNALPLNESATIFHTKRSERKLSPIQQLSFNDLWQKVNNQGKMKQLSNDNKEENLPGKNDLEKILLTENNIQQEKVWAILNNDGKECGLSSPGHNTDCGFLGLHGKNFDYKIRINYERDTEKKSTGRIGIVREAGEQLSANLHGQGTTISTINFAKLSTFTQQNQIEGQKIESPSFIHSAQLFSK